MKKLFVIFFLFAFTVMLRAQDSVQTLDGQPLVSGAANGVGTNALFNTPAGIVADTHGNFFVADSQNHAIRKISKNGLVTTFAGTLGVAGTANATGTSAQFNAPSGLAFDAMGNLLVADAANDAIRTITPDGSVTTFAGVAGLSGFLDGTAGNALFSSPLGIAVWTNGDVYVSDSGNHCIRRISGGVVSTFAGNPQVWGSSDGRGTNAQFNSPCGLAFDAGGDLFVCDANNNTIRKIATNGFVTTFAGVAGEDGAVDGAPTSARFRSPAELALDHKGNIFIADSLNHTIRAISVNGLVTTVSGLAQVAGTADGVNGMARFFNPYGVAVAADGSLVVADAYNDLVRSVMVPFKLSLQIFNGLPTKVISWDTVAGKKYQVQFKSDLTAPWVDFGSATVANGLSLSVTDNATGSMRIYQVLRIN